MEWQPLHSHSFPQTSTFNHHHPKLVIPNISHKPKPKPMVPNLDLIVLACLHGSFIALILLLIISVTLVVLVLSSSLALFSVFAGDVYDGYSVLCVYYEEVKGVVELSVCLMVCGLIGFVVNVVLGVKCFVREQNERFSIKQKKVKEKWRIGIWCVNE